MGFRISSVALAGVALAALCTSAHAEGTNDAAPTTAWQASQTHASDSMIATGVARARDRLDSATSTSSLSDNEITSISATSLADLFRNIPGIRAEAGSGEVFNNYTIRGLPLVSTGAKYLQFQEDGLPVMEFGDFLVAASDAFIRVDSNVAQIESIRGGSASTFASNSPGGVINLISKTGEVEGGAVQLSSGVNYQSYRTDFDYGGHLDPTLRFHIGGFFREGDGPRHAGFDADHGGQVKFNITKEFTGGFVRLEAKVLDDHNAQYMGQPMAVTGTDSNPHYQNLPGFSANSDTVLSRYISVLPTLDANGNLSQTNVQDGSHAKAAAVGFQAKFDVADWVVSEHIRYTHQSGSSDLTEPETLLPAQFAASALGSPGGSLAYASGPLEGQPITNPMALNGNGLLALSLVLNLHLRNLSDVANDIRASRVWALGDGNLTATTGMYASRQDFDVDNTLLTVLQDVRGGGRSALVNVASADGTPNTLGGVVNFYGLPSGGTKNEDVTYTVLAPYGSLNYHQGKLSIGGSARLDEGTVAGTIRESGPTDLKTIDVNNTGVIAKAETTFAYAPLGNDQPVNYTYHYLSYSASANYRFAEVFSAFARYSRGARAGADHLLFSPAISSLDGSLVRKTSAYDPAKQAELGLKYRKDGFFANVTAFWAKVSETNTQIGPDPVTGGIGLLLIDRAYRAYGGEFEGGIRHGGFNLTGSATMTNARITAAETAALVGNTPRHQAKLIYQVMPQYETKLFTIGADIIGTTSSFAQDEDRLKMPGYTTVNAFLQVRPVERVVVSLNVDNLFGALALTSVLDASVPSSGTTVVQTLYGRTIRAAIRFYF